MIKSWEKNGNHWFLIEKQIRKLCNHLLGPKFTFCIWTWLISSTSYNATALYILAHFLLTLVTYLVLLTYLLSARTWSLVLLIMRPWNWVENRYPESWLGLVYHLSSQYWLIMALVSFCSFSVENQIIFSWSTYDFKNYQSRKQKKN